MIEGFLNQEITITPKNSSGKFDGFGAPVAGTPFTTSARVQEVQNRIEKTPDTYIDIRLEIWLKPDVVIENDDMVAWDGEIYYAERIDPKRDMCGVLDHIKVLCR